MMTVHFPRWLRAALLLPLAFQSGDGTRAEERTGTVRGPVPVSEAAARMTVPDGFRVSLFAGEPDVRQPIAMAFDDRGRLWVAECYSYPGWLSPGVERKDRIVIFEDRDGDGRFDDRKVFWDQGTFVTGLELGFGGVWVCNTPELLFIPDRDGDDRPDAEPEVVLDGWDPKGEHNVFNGLAWGPDGWLWGCHGIMSTSRVGKPGSPDDQRVAINCGVWRFHPTRKTFEVVANGTTNPWGVDWDDLGEAYITNCVIPHLYRVVPGAHFERMYGNDFNPHLYRLIASTADHIHWAGGYWVDSRAGLGKHGEAGGGHAHSGTMIYLGGSWPEEYRGSLFTCNIHGNRVNRDVFRPAGSGPIASHAPDFLLANDPWFRGIALKYGPDGSVFVIDWSDTDECHDTDSNGPERQTGRIFKVSYGQPRHTAVDLARASDAELVDFQRHPNDWFVRHARRLLQERAAAGKPMSEVHRALRVMLAEERSAPRQLRALWALHATGGLDEARLIGLLDHKEDAVRGWAIRLLAQEAALTPAAVERFETMARLDPSPRVRLQLASTLQRLEPGRRWEIARGLIGHGEDREDLYLPLMIWYGVEPLAGVDASNAAGLALASQIPLVRQLTARRLVAAAEGVGSPGLAELIAFVATSDDAEARLDVLRGLREGYAGRKSSPGPEGWDRVAARLDRAGDEEKEHILILGLQFGDPSAVPSLRARVLDEAIAPDARARAIEALADRRLEGLSRDLIGLLREPRMRSASLRALAAFDDPDATAAIIGIYAQLDPSQKTDALATLASRPRRAAALLEAIEARRIPARDLPVATVRQILAFNDATLTARLESAWGTIRPASADKASRLARYKAVLAPEEMRAADPGRGRLVFSKACQSCHKLFDAGGAIGPELTGSNRANVDYLLENVLDPSAVVANEYRLANVATTDGRLVSGMILDQNDRTVVVQTANEKVSLPREEIEQIQLTTSSMMPEGLFDPLSDTEVRDLAAYLSSPEQVPQPSASTP